jgi:hypothetical protein
MLLSAGGIKDFFRCTPANTAAAVKNSVNKSTICVSTNPSPTGSETAANTIGIVDVSRCSAAVGEVPCARITSGWRRTSSLAYIRCRLRSEAPHRISKRTFRPSVAARYAIPAMYFNPTYFAGSGGLIGYSDDYEEESRLAAAYIDRILRGEKPADLPVQNPTKY